MRQRLLVAGLVVLCLAASALALYTMRLDVELRARFDGVRWALPAQIYAAPLELYAGKRLTPQDVVHELRRLGYRSRADAQRAGTYAVVGDRGTAPSGKPGFVTRLYFNPLVAWMWGGLMIMVAGGALSLTDRRHRVGAPTRSTSAAPAAAGAD